MIEATDFYLEPLASFQCIATAPEGGDGVPVHISAGAGHASLGGGSKFDLLLPLWKKNKRGDDFSRK
jgi:hypothetical protein